MRRNGRLAVVGGGRLVVVGVGLAVVVGVGRRVVVGGGRLVVVGGLLVVGLIQTVVTGAVVTGGRPLGRLHAFGGQCNSAARVLKLMPAAAGAASARWWAITAPSNTAAIPNALTARHHRGVDSPGGG